MKPPAEPDLPKFAQEALDGRNDARLLDALTALLPETLPPAGGKARLMSQISSPRLEFAPLFNSLASLFDLDDAALGELFERAADASAWSRSELESAELLHLAGGPRAAQADNGLVRIAAGARFPWHRHLGPEQVLVLSGGYRDEPSGRVFLPGDLHSLPAGSSHAYVALAHGPLLLAVSLINGIELEPTKHP